MSAAMLGQGAQAGYLVELYVANGDVEELPATARQLQEAAEALSSSGTPVRLVGTVFAAHDELWFCFLEAASPEAVTEAARRAGLVYERVQPAVPVAPAREARS